MTRKEAVALMFEYAQHGAKDLAPMLDPAAGGTPAIAKSKGAAIQATARCVGSADERAARVVAWVLSHPKPQAAVRDLQRAYSSAKWDAKALEMGQ